MMSAKYLIYQTSCILLSNHNHIDEMFGSFPFTLLYRNMCMPKAGQTEDKRVFCHSYCTDVNISLLAYQHPCHCDWGRASSQRHHI